jgi:hypothetical protein
VRLLPTCTLDAAGTGCTAPPFQGTCNAGGTCVAIPTLSEWRILLLAIAMLGVALRRRAIRRPG